MPVFECRRPLRGALAGAILSLAISVSCSAGLFDTNLLVNPNAEDGFAGNGSILTNAPGWISNGELNVVSYSAGGRLSHEP